MVNKVILLGNLGKDPEVRSTSSGQQVANFTLATNRRWRDRDGNRQEQTEWHYIVVWGRQAEVAGQYLTRGSKIYLEGRLQTRSWDDRNTGEKRYRTEVVCENLQMLGGNRDGGGGGYGGEKPGHSQSGGYGGGYQQQAGDSSPGVSVGPSDFGPGPEDDDIPF